MSRDSRITPSGPFTTWWHGLQLALSVQLLCLGVLGSFLHSARLLDVVSLVLGTLWCRRILRHLRQEKNRLHYRAIRTIACVLGLDLFLLALYLGSLLFPRSGPY